MLEVKWTESRSVVSDFLWPHELYSPWDSPGQTTGVGSLSLLQGIFSTQESNQGFLHCWRILYQLSHQAIPSLCLLLRIPPQKWKDVALILAPSVPPPNPSAGTQPLQSTLSSSLLLKRMFQDSSEWLFSPHQVNKSDFVWLQFCSLWSLAD